MGIEPRTDLGRINLSCKPQRRARLWMDHWYWSFSPNMEQDLYFLFISFSISFFILFFFFLFYIFFFFLYSYFWVYFCSIFWENRRTGRNHERAVELRFNLHTSLSRIG